mmetsp:Transcript_359/g.639  ORF Transcript_359/g.639 Transcript_359/m.639 type:complete len:238 (+) Transcript_359:111-824(+)
MNTLPFLAPHCQVETRSTRLASLHGNIKFPKQGCIAQTIIIIIIITIRSTTNTITMTTSRINTSNRPQLHQTLLQRTTQPKTNQHVHPPPLFRQNLPNSPHEPFDISIEPFPTQQGIQKSLIHNDIVFNLLFLHLPFHQRLLQVRSISHDKIHIGTGTAVHFGYHVDADGTVVEAGDADGYGGEEGIVEYAREGGVSAACDEDGGHFWGVVRGRGCRGGGCVFFVCLGMLLRCRIVV